MVRVMVFGPSTVVLRSVAAAGSTVHASQVGAGSTVSRYRSPARVNVGSPGPAATGGVAAAGGAMAGPADAAAVGDVATGVVAVVDGAPAEPPQAARSTTSRWRTRS